MLSKVDLNVSEINRHEDNVETCLRDVRDHVLAGLNALYGNNEYGAIVITIASRSIDGPIGVQSLVVE
jgi:hypothetical protein